MCHVYISLNKYAHNWFSRVLFIATHNEIVIENGYQYLFPKMKKNEILMYLCYKNVDIFLAAKYCKLKWCNSFMQT